MKTICQSRPFIGILCLFLVFSLTVTNIAAEAKRDAQRFTPSAVVSATVIVFAVAAGAGAVIGATQYGLERIFTGDDFSGSRLAAHMTVGAASMMANLAMVVFSSGTLNAVLGVATQVGVTNYFTDLLEGFYQNPGSTASSAWHVLSSTFKEKINMLQNDMETIIDSTIQSLVSFEGEDPTFSNSLPCSVDFGETITTSNSNMPVACSGMDYSTFYGAWRMTTPGTSQVETEFHLDAVPSKAFMSLIHLTSYNAGSPGNGYSPIDIYVNGTRILDNYDVAQSHGDHGWHTDNWPIASYLKTGTNKIRIELENDPWAATHYWIRYISVQEGIAPGDNYEPNDTWQTAYNIGSLTAPLEIPNLSCCHDDDWFKFTTVQTGSSGDSVKINFSHAQGDLDMRLYRRISSTFIQEVADSPSNGSSDEETILLDGLDGGTYLIKVYGYNGATNPKYTLSIDPPGNTRQQGNYLSIDTDDVVWNEAGNDDNDGHPELGEKAGAIIPICASASVQYVEATLSASPFSAVNITDDEEYYGSIAGGGSVTAGDFDMDILQANVIISFTLYIEYERNGYLYYQNLTFSHSFPEEVPPLDFERDGFSQEMNPNDDWNGNGVFNSGDEAWIRFNIKNNSDFTAYDVEAALCPVNIPGVHIENDYIDYEGFGDMTPGQSAWPEDSADHWRIDADKNYSGTFTADILVIYDGIDENNPVVIPDAVQVTVYPQPWLDVQPEQLDFGVTATYTPVQVETFVENRGSAALVIDGINIVAQSGINVDVEPPLPWDPIQPGENLPITITIDPSAFEGQVDPPIEVIMQTSAPYDVDDQEDRIKISGLVSTAAPIFNIPGNPQGGEPDASGNIVVWEDYRNGNYDIYAYNLDTNEEMQITDNAASQSDPKISGNLIVWEDLRNEQPDEDNQDIYGYDLTLGQEFIVSNNPMDENLIGVDENQIAFTRVYHILDEYEDGRQFEELYNLFLFDYDGNRGGTEQNLTGFTPGSYYSNKESIYGSDYDFGGGTLVWEEATWFLETQYTTDRWENTNTRLRKMQVSTNSCGVDPSPLTIYSGNVNSISADDCRIVFEESVDSDDQIFKWENGSIAQLTPIPVNVESENENAAIGGNFVVYWKEVDVSGPDPKFLVALNLSTGEETVITEDVPDDGWRMDGNLLVFQNQGTKEIRYTYLNDGHAPSLGISDPSEDIAVSNLITSYSFSGTASDSDGSITKVDYRIGEGAWQLANGTTNWDFLVNDFSIGINSIEVRAQDNDRNYSNIASRMITRNSLPSLTITTPGADPVITDNSSYTFAGTTSDSDGKVTCVEYRLVGGSWHTALGTVDWNFTVTDLAMGDNVVEVCAKDNYNDHSSTASRTIIRAIKGDINGDADIAIDDAILALQVMSGIDIAGQDIIIGADVNEDGKIGMEEVIYVLQKVSGLRQ